jgi:hypothetical protein
MLLTWLAQVNVHVHEAGSDPEACAIVNFIDVCQFFDLTDFDDLIIFDENRSNDIKSLRRINDPTIA